MQYGPSFETVPATTREVCTGCAWLHVAGIMDSDAKAYYCTHDKAGHDEGVVITTLGPYRSIIFNTHATPGVPGWCPYKKLAKP